MISKVIQWWWKIKWKTEHKKKREKKIKRCVCITNLMMLGCVDALLESSNTIGF